MGGDYPKRYHDHSLAGIRYGQEGTISLSIRGPDDVEHVIILEDVEHFLVSDLLAGNIIDTVDSVTVSPDNQAVIAASFRGIGSQYYADDACRHLALNPRLLGKLFVSVGSSYGAEIRAIVGGMRETGPALMVTHSAR